MREGAWAVPVVRINRTTDLGKRSGLTVPCHGTVPIYLPYHSQVELSENFGQLGVRAASQTIRGSRMVGCGQLFEEFE